MAMGFEALKENIDGSENVGLGTESFRDNTNGVRNTGVGTYALRANTTGNNNTAMDWTLYGTTQQGRKHLPGLFSMQGRSGIDPLYGNASIGYHSLWIPFLQPKYRSGALCYDKLDHRRNKCGHWRRVLEATTIKQLMLLGFWAMRNNTEGTTMWVLDIKVCILRRIAMEEPHTIPGMLRLVLMRFMPTTPLPPSMVM